MPNQLSTTCISLLTQLLDLNSLEGLLDEERESYVLKNIQAELGHSDSKDVLFEDAVEKEDEQQEKKDKKFHKKLMKSSSKDSNNLFGGKLNEHSVTVVIKIIEHLKDYTDVEGLFRISGNKRRQEELKSTLNKGQFVDLADRTYSQHDLTTILKQFFAELSEPLLTNSLYFCYKQVAGKTREMDGSISVKKRLTALQLLNLLLPPLNRLLFKELIGLLHLVSEKTINLMTPKNLAVVFAPNIAAKTKISCLSDYSDNLEPLTEIIEFLIENANSVFKVPDDFFGPKQRSKPGPNVLGTPKVFCRQYDARNYQQETVKTTNDALAELYAQVLNMPENHPMKKQFLDDFKRKYPGTPPFVPKCRMRPMESPGKRTPMLKRSREKLDDVTGEPFEQEDGMFLSTPEKKRLFTEGDLAEHLTPDSRNSGRITCENGQVFEITKEKKRFRRPSFSRPSFGFFSKRSTPDLRKLRKTPVPATESSKRMRSNSATECADTDPKRRFSFTPFLDRKNNQQRAMTEKHASKKSNKVSISSENEKMFESKASEFGKVNFGHFLCDSSESRNTNEMPVIKGRPRPMLRAPLINIKSAGKSLIPPSLNPRRETLALHKEQDFNIEAFRPRRETLAIQSHTPTIIPFKPRREKLVTEKGQPILESFKPKRDSLLIHKKAQPQFELMKSVKKDVYNDFENSSTICQSKQDMRKTKTENYERTAFNKEQHDHKQLFSREVDSPVKFTSFGKGLIDNDEDTSQDTKGGYQLHGRRMSTGSIMRSGLTQMKSWDEGYMVTYL